jgi:hypothetical protein
MVKCPLEKRRDWSRVVLKLNSRSVQWWTLNTVSSWNALMGALAKTQNELGKALECKSFSKSGL